jgi:ankyrin repeat protein
MARGCLLGIVFLAALFGAYYVVLTPRVEWPGNAFLSGFGAVFSGIFISGLFGVFRAYRDARRLRGASSNAVGTFKDGETVAVAGTIRPLDAPLTAPFSGTPCVAYDYDIVHIAHRSTSNGTETYEQHDISGLALTPSIIDTPTGGVRLLSFAMLEEFPRQVQNSPSAHDRARDFVARTTFKPMGLTKVFTAFNALSEALTDEDGAVRMDWRMTDGEINYNSATIRERLVLPGQQVNAVGKYSTERRGLIAEGMASLIQLRPGDAQTASRKMVGSAWSTLAIGTLFFVVCHAFIVGVFFMSETRYKRVSASQQESALRIAVQNRSAEEVQRVIRQGVDPNVHDSNGRTVLHDLREADMVRVLIAAGAKPDVIDSDGYTPLMLAARMGLTDVVTALIDGKASVNLARPDGGTALNDAIEGGHEDTAAFLRTHGAASDLITAENGDPLPADGGEPMETIRTYMAAIHARDEKAIAATLVGKASFEHADWDFYHRYYPEKPVFLSGFTNGKVATLDVGGPTILKPSPTWHYQLVYKGEVWRIARSWDTDEGKTEKAEPVEQPRPH